MDYQSAAAASSHRMGVLTINDSNFEVHDEGSNSFFASKPGNPEGTWLVDRKPGRGNRKSTEWLPLEIPALAGAVQAWMANQEGRGLVIVQPWDLACLNSPVNRAMRVKRDGLLMVRTGDKVTWSEDLGGTVLSRVAGPFKQYDGWDPVPADHFYATADLSVPYSIRFGEGGRLGTRAFTKPAEAVPKPRRKKVPNPAAPPIAVSQEALGTAALIAQSLSQAIGSTSGETQKSLAAELVRLASHVSWHLREDRGKYRDPTPVPAPDGLPVGAN